MKIFKHYLPSTPSDFDLFTPRPILDIQVIDNKIVLWGFDRALILTRWKIVETGKEFTLPIEFSFIKTVQLYEGRYILHIFKEA